MLGLTRDTVEDSATVRVVTIVTLVYLPASFVSVSIDEGYYARKLTTVSLCWEPIYSPFKHQMDQVSRYPSNFGFS
jgi:hypothetical protein